MKKLVILGAGESGVGTAVLGKKKGFENNRDWFKLIYEVLLGSQSGPRLGSFFSLLGKDKTVEKLNEVLR